MFGGGGDLRRFEFATFYINIYEILYVDRLTFSLYFSFVGCYSGFCIVQGL